MRELSLAYLINSGDFRIRNFRAVSSSLSGRVVKNILACLPDGASSTRVMVRSEALLALSRTNSAAKRCNASPTFSLFISRIC